MARSRNIKPGYFQNDVLAECDPLARILFAGLWGIADREGRLEYRPKKIKVQVLPYDDCNIEELIGQLESKYFIVRYEHHTSTVQEPYKNCPTTYIQITEFLKHQNPHKSEAASNIPSLEESTRKNETSESKSDNPNIINEIKQHHTSTIQEQYKNTTNPADSLNLIPDSLNLIPDSLETNQPRTKQAKEKKKQTRFVKPTLEEIKTYCAERKNSVNPIKFFNHYESNGWKVGKNSMKNWKSAVITWENSGYNENTSNVTAHPAMKELPDVL